MQKYSHNSRRVQKELGGDAYALSGRIASIETEIGSSTYTGDSITDAISDAQSDITRFKGYEETLAKRFTFDIATATEQTLKDVLENSEVVDWFKASSSHASEWTKFQIVGIGNNTLDGTYDKTFTTKKHSDYLSYKEFKISAAGQVTSSKMYRLKADTTSGAISYDNTNLDITGSYTKIYISFMKGDLS